MNKGNDGASATTRQPVRNGSDLAVATYEVSDQTQEKEKPVVQTQRYLQIQNNTGQPLKVFVQVRTQTDQGGWAWFPADPGSSKRAFSLNIEPGKKLYLSSEGSPISASRVRIWAVAGPLQWAQYKAQDLWLVPEVDENGKHHYFAPDMKTFTFIFGAKR